MPIWLPSITFPVAPGSIRIPCCPLPAMTLFSWGLVPPTVVLFELR